MVDNVLVLHKGHSHASQAQPFGSQVIRVLIAGSASGQCAKLSDVLPLASGVVWITSPPSPHSWLAAATFGAVETQLQDPLRGLSPSEVFPAQAASLTQAAFLTQAASLHKLRP